MSGPTEPPAGPDDPGRLWGATLRSLDQAGIPAPQRAFLRQASLVGVLDTTALIAVPDDFTKEIVESRARDYLVKALTEQVGREVRLAVTVDASLREQFSPSEQPMLEGYPAEEIPAGEDGAPQPVAQADADPVPVAGERRPRPATATPREESSQLNPKYTFDTFVIGASNRFAHAAAVAVAEAPAKAYNPLFVYGESGLGKTHLLHAIGHYARNLYPHVKVKYVNSEEFTNDFINSIRDDKAAGFHRRYRDMDVLLIDDIQFLQGKMQTQEE
ncbi:MAG: DnaA/Hda family protein, partial [Mobilicoccus sp.]|nr:DnaA/Hda family protein [Mobilicoccus sp.]